MSFQYQQGLWQPHATIDHATDILNNINTILQQNDVRDPHGNLIQLAAVLGNGLWLFCLADGQHRADFDEILLAASKALSISECSDAQVLLTLPIAGTDLLPGTFSTLNVRVSADGGGDVHLSAGDTLPFGSVCNFVVLEATTVPAGTTVTVPTIADTRGAILVPLHAITAFTGSIAHVSAVDNAETTVAGDDPETVPEVRRRLIAGRIADLNLDGTIRAVRAIQGINKAQIYLNIDTVNDLVLEGGIHVLPRHAYVVITGHDPTGTAIASAYAARMTAETQGSATQDFVTQSGQLFPVRYDVAAAQSVYVTVFYDPDSIQVSGFEGEVRAAVEAMGAEVTIGQRITAAMVLQQFVGFTDVLVIGAEVSLDGVNYSNEVIPDANKLPTFDDYDIDVTPGGT